jgi:hypothetical protein
MWLLLDPYPDPTPFGGSDRDRDQAKATFIKIKY